jgi:hypothetical protein
MDELRIWKVELTVDEIRQMMNQSEQWWKCQRSNCTIEHAGLTWANLDGCTK